MPPETETQRASESHRARESHRPSESSRLDFSADAGLFLQQMTPQDIRASNERQHAERLRNAINLPLPPLQICDSTNGSPLSQINGATFDRNRNGSVSIPELEQSINDRQTLRAYPCAGAAAMTLRNRFDEIRRLHFDLFSDGISQNDFSALQRLRPESSMARDINSEMTRSNYNGQLEGLFDQSFGIAPDAVRQGNLGDCTFQSTMASLANTERGRQFLSQMIQPNGDGFRVRFGNGQTIDTARPNQFEMGTYALDSRRGIWPNVAERAFGMARVSNENRGILENILAFVVGRAHDPLRPQAATERMSADEVFSTVFGTRANREQIVLTGVDDEQLHTRLANISPRALAMVASTPSIFLSTPSVEVVGAPGVRENLHTSHSYMFDHYNAETRDVYLRNPWDGSEMLRMPLGTFRRNFLLFNAVLESTPPA